MIYPSVELMHIAQCTVHTLTHAGTGGLMQPPPCGFSGISFFVNRSIVTIFSIAFRPSFLRPPWKIQDPDPPNIWPMTS